MRGGGAEKLVATLRSEDVADALEKLARAILERSPDIAHDIKTPLNIVVLNVELLKMRLRGIAAEIDGDEKIHEHCRAIDRETRRVSAIADAFLSVARLPEEKEPERRNVTAALGEAFRAASFRIEDSDACELSVYSSRLEKAARLLAKGIAAVIDPQQANVECTVSDGLLKLKVSGPIRDETLETGKLFKFYYTDPSGEPNLTLASARLLLESMDGSIEMQISDEIAEFQIELQGDE